MAIDKFSKSVSIIGPTMVGFVEGILELKILRGLETRILRLAFVNTVIHERTILLIF